jgi:hypothetical protein
MVSALVPAGIALAVLLAGVPAAAQAPSSDPVLRVEEDWLLLLNEPGALVDAPQFHTVMSPFPNLDSYYAQVLWNYRESSLDTIFLGGLQLQSWNGETKLRTRSVGIARLSTTAEIITWTQALQTDGVLLSYDITNGQSITWGQFGKDMNITQDASVPDLNQYDTNTSIQSSWITYGSNRVDLLVITEVRKYGQNGLISVDSTPRVVHLHGDIGPGGDPGSLEQWLNEH